MGKAGLKLLSYGAKDKAKAWRASFWAAFELPLHKQELMRSHLAFHGHSI